MRSLGHDGPPAQLWTENLLSGKTLERCPMRTVLLEREKKSLLMREVDRYVDVYFPAYEDKHLLVEGGLADQPARYVDLIQLVRRIDRDTEAKYHAIKNEDGE